jgi:hypothetical protein
MNLVWMLDAWMLGWLFEVVRFATAKEAFFTS